MTLDEQMRQVLAQLEMASHTSASSSDSGRITHGKPGGNQPPRVSAPYLHFRARYERCRNVVELARLVEEAETELSSLRYAKRGPAHATKEHRLMIGTDPREAKDVARIWGCSIGHVYRCRKEAAQVPDSVRERAKVTGSQRTTHP